MDDSITSTPASPAPAAQAAGAESPADVNVPGDASCPGLGFCVLGSGSGGNASVLRLGDEGVLLDAGFGPVTTAKRLQQAGLSLAGIRAICLTHLDQDHFRPHWVRTLLGWNIPVHMHAWHAQELSGIDPDGELHRAGLVRPFEWDAFCPMPGLSLQPIALAHDHKGTFAFRCEAGDCAMGYATDLGVAPPALVKAFAGVDVLAIESNYDPPMQLQSARPVFLKRRIMGGQGHLSNQQAFEAACQIARRSKPGLPRHIVLLHRSAQCNHPDRIRETFAQDPSIARRVVLTEQRRRSRWFDVRPQPRVVAQQMLFGFA